MEIRQEKKTPQNEKRQKSGRQSSDISTLRTLVPYLSGPSDLEQGKWEEIKTTGATVSIDMCAFVYTLVYIWKMSH